MGGTGWSQSGVLANTVVCYLANQATGPPGKCNQSPKRLSLSIQGTVQGQGPSLSFHLGGLTGPVKEPSSSPCIQGTAPDHKPAGELALCRGPWHPCDRHTIHSGKAPDWPAPPRVVESTPYFLYKGGLTSCPGAYNPAIPAHRGPRPACDRTHYLTGGPCQEVHALASNSTFRRTVQGSSCTMGGITVNTLCLCTCLLLILAFTLALEPPC